MRTESVFAAMAAVLLCAAACSSSAPQPDPPVSGTYSESTVTTSARVEQIDYAMRRVVLRDTLGRGIEMKVPQDVENLSQVKVGDEVVVSYYESIAYEVRKPGSGQMGSSVDVDMRRTEVDGMPGARATETRTVTVAIEAIDMNRPSVTLRGNDGRLVTVPVKDRSKLERVAVGDLVEITYTEALMASVQPKR